MMSDEGSIEDGLEGLLPDIEVSNLMRKMNDMNLPVSQEEIQVLSSSSHSHSFKIRIICDTIISPNLT